jgi:hypothetical protein
MRKMFHQLNLDAQSSSITLFQDQPRVLNSTQLYKKQLLKMYSNLRLSKEYYSINGIWLRSMLIHKHL